MAKKPASKASRKTTAEGDATTQRRGRASPAELPESDPQQKPFTPKVLDRTAIAIPLLEELIKEEEAIKTNPGTKRKRYPVIIDLHLEFPGGRGARMAIRMSLMLCTNAFLFANGIAAPASTKKKVIINRTDE